MKRYLCYKNVISWRLVETSIRTHFPKIEGWRISGVFHSSDWCSF